MIESNKNRKMRRAGWLAVLVLLLLIGAGCDDGGGDGFQPITDGCFSFAPAEEPAPGKVTAREGPDFACSLGDIELIVTGVDDVFATNIQLRYGSSVSLFFATDTQGSLLRDGGTDVEEVVGTDVIGQTTIGVTRLQSETGVDVGDSESRALIRLIFLTFVGASGSDEITIEGPCLLGSEEQPQLKTDVTCTIGTLTVS